MYTQQSNALAAALSLPAGQQQTQAILQVFANCVQGLRTNGPVNINTGAGQQPPRGGVINRPPGVGGAGNQSTPTGNPLTDYYNGGGNRPPGQYAGGTWNPNGPGSGGGISLTGPTIINNGGDTSYGDTYQTNNNVNGFYSYNNYNANSDNSVHNNNVNNWYENQYTDNSYNDFSTTLNTTQNMYSQTVNNFEGDSYFDNTVHQGPVTNLSTVVNQGDVINQGDTYMDETKTFITNNENTINLQSYIINLVVNILQGKGDKGEPGVDAIAKALNYNFEGTDKPFEVEVEVNEFNPETCTNSPKKVKGSGKYKPEGAIVRKP